MRKLFYALLLLCGNVAANAQTVGFFSQTASSQDGYVLFAPISSTTTYLIDKCGKLVHTWPSSHRPGQSVYLLPDGSLLRPGSVNNTVFNAGGNGGIIERYDWSGSLLWSYTISGAAECQHHDICYLPNGNILAIVWELKSTADAIAAGRDPSLLGTSLWSEKIVELQPSGSTASIVWEWHAWDHLAQDYDDTKANYDTIANHPEKININYYNGVATNSDWLHINAISYNPILDQVMVSVHNFDEIWIIDHSTSTAEAASHTGGAHNKGGDLLYRWGNPASYDRGTAADRKLYGQHNAHWIENDLADSGKIMVFNNGAGRPAGNYSTVDIITPPVDASGDYLLLPGVAYAPDSASWQYKAPTPTDFYGMNISGAQRLPNGNTLICVGPSGTLFEIDTAKNIAWKYIVPVNNSGPITQGTAPTQNSTFRCTLYTATYSGFTGHTLTAGNPIELSPLTYDCFSGTTGLDENIAATNGVKVVNPFTSSIILAAGGEYLNTNVSLSDMNGKICQQWKNVNLPQGQQKILELDATLPAGIYILRINNEKNSSVIKLATTGQ